MRLLTSLSFLFWTPLFVVIMLKFFLANRLKVICFDKGYMTPLTFRCYLRSTISARNELYNFIEHIISSLNLKGVIDMGKIFGLRPDQTLEFVPKGQDDVAAKERLVFMYKPLDVNHTAAIADAVYTAKGFGNKREELLRAGTQEVAVLRRGLVGWKNFFYDDGTKIEWDEIPKGLNRQKSEVIMDKNLNKIPNDQRSELADQIRGMSTADSD